MGWLGVALLLIVWAGILGPALLSRRRPSPVSTVHRFERSMGILAGNRRSRRRSAQRSDGGRYVLVLDDAERVSAPDAGGPDVSDGRRPRRLPAASDRRPVAARTASATAAPGGVPSPPGSPSMVRRRLAVLRGLLAAMLISVLAWVLLGPVGAALLGVSVVTLVVYCALLATVRARTTRRADRERLARSDAGDASPTPVPDRRRRGPRARPEAVSQDLDQTVARGA